MHEDPELAATLALMVSEALGRDAAPEENFFDAGMDSAALVALHERISERLDADFPITELFAHPNLEALVGFVAASA
ncbi:acyl carrier protein, partial [Actinomadura adrarensis]